MYPGMDESLSVLLSSEDDQPWSVRCRGFFRPPPRLAMHTASGTRKQQQPPRSKTAVVRNAMCPDCGEPVASCCEGTEPPLVCPLELSSLTTVSAKKRLLVLGRLPGGCRAQLRHREHRKRGWKCRQERRNSGRALWAGDPPRWRADAAGEVVFAYNLREVHHHREGVIRRDEAGCHDVVPRSIEGRGDFCVARAGRETGSAIRAASAPPAAEAAHVIVVHPASAPVVI
eukprot:CAMPEP_0179177318 /NCGR_PEP_ID=MMETSP0796-20121207/87688_1 /TAXON_ID=73915 /ORGANISM="Pyrodinium bahamense, Strain pbaha01" /LENGTH=228 /DNA_ID=CAMNT_0020880865 /DNA_START=351 /DNA_END=1037 /DNA_ORIENTATION=+